MRSAILVVSALAASCDGLVVGLRAPVAGLRAPRHARAGRVLLSEEEDNSPEARERAAAAKAATAAERRARAAELELGAEALDALAAASKDVGPCWTGGAASCPPALKTMFGQPEDFYSALRSPRSDPAPEVWDCVRSKYPALAEQSDDDLLAALQPIKEEYVDRRSLRK